MTVSFQCIEQVQRLEYLLRQAPGKYERVFRKKYGLERNSLRWWYQKIKYFCSNVWQKVWILLLWVGIVLGLFVYKFAQYRNKAVYGVMGNCICIAKGAAETLKFNMALVLLPVCRNTITWLRNKTELGRIVPFDNNLDFHMVMVLKLETSTDFVLYRLYHIWIIYLIMVSLYALIWNSNW